MRSLRAEEASRMVDEPPWRRPPDNVRLPGRQVHVWRARLDLPRPRQAALLSVLSFEERARAEGFRSERDRARFIAAHGLLRIVLGLYLSTPPGRIAFSGGAYGKPQLNADCASSLKFNMSHSDALALFAVSRGREVGVDVERIRPGPPMADLAKRLFSPGETAALLALPAERLPTAFFECWTRNEALLKATGRGWSAPCVQGERRGLGAETSRWSVWGLSVRRGYAAAVAAEGHDWTLKCWRHVEPGA